MAKKIAEKKRWLRPGWLFIPALLLGASYTRAITSPGNFSASQTGYQEVPPVFTGASGSCSVKIKGDGTSASYELTYTGLSSAVTQAHIHFGPQPSNGGIIVFLCDNTGPAPRVVPTCPTSPATVTGTLTSADVNPPKDPEPVTGQGIPPGAFAGLVGAIEHGDAYCNVHTKSFPAGEIRGWLR
jgi:hypothetical protein